MRSLHLYGTCALVLALAALAAAEDGAAGPREIFRVTFDEGTPNAVLARGAAAPYQARVDEYVSGAVGKAAVMKKKYAAIRFDGRGNIDLSRGTWGFFYQFVEEPNVREWESLVSVASDVEGYWSGVTQVIQRSERVQLHFFDAGRYTPRMDFKPIYKRWKAGEWHHLAFVWDRDQGLKLYEDGVPVDDHWGKHRWDFTNSPRMLALGEWIYSSLQFGIDEVRIFSDALTDAQVAQLAKGQDPTGAPRPRAPAEETLQRELKRMGWTADEAAALPALEAGSGARFVQARIVSANDACRQINQPYDGLWDSTWPLQRYGASTKGRRLDLATEEGSSFDRVRLFMHRPFRGRLMELDPAKGPVELCRLDAEDGVFLRAKLPKPCANTRVFLEREGGWLGQIELSRAEPLGAARAAHETLCLHPLEKMPDTLMGHALLAETHPDGDAPARAAADSCPRWTKRTPACGGLQILAGSYPEPVALNGVRLKLVVEGLTEPTAVQVKVKEPVMSDRNWLTAEAVLQPKGEGAQTYVLQLEGRPVVPFPGGEKGPALELGLALSASKPLTWVLGEGGTTVETLATDLEKALPVATADQIEWAREAYSQTNEGHIWDNVGLQGWGCSSTR
ncbi:MAG: LamG domain-containing protein [Planctomycetota bacterium]|nr:LamG domain-containing protein [Planctomycetota bacterium]